MDSLFQRQIEWLCVVYTHFFDLGFEINTDDFVQRLMKLSQIGALGWGSKQSHTGVSIVTRSHAIHKGEILESISRGQQTRQIIKNVSVFCYCCHDYVFLQRFN